jgi:3-methyladenine DNA glycosylase AlkD
MFIYNINNQIIMELIYQIRKELQKKARKKTKQGAEKYFKGVIPFYGLKSPQIEKITKKFYKQNKQLKINETLKLAKELLESTYFEEKHTAIILLNLNKDKLVKENLPFLKKVFEENVNNWATCDVLCSKVVYWIVKKQPETAKIIVSWKDSPQNWVKRACAVVFVKLGKTGKYTKEIFTVSNTLLDTKDRFVQLGIGWALRECWLGEPESTQEFIKRNKDRFIKEALRYATEKMDEKTKNYVYSQ